MRTTLVVGAAPVPGADDFYRTLLADATHVVAADAAGEWCIVLGRVPDAVVGDFDSAIEGARERLTTTGVEIVEYPADKDRTDLELAVDLAHERFDAPVTLTAAFTSRLDHTLGALGTLLRSGVHASAREPGWTAWICAPGAELHLAASPGTLVSLLAPGGAHGVGIAGVRWPLHDATLPMLSGRGVSNVALGDKVVVSVQEGTLIVFVSVTPL
jgi:thiamine pyrophosphokinase